MVKMTKNQAAKRVIECQKKLIKVLESGHLSLAQIQPAMTNLAKLVGRLK
jgi:chromatin remodeling complex protein RSC6